MLWISAIYICVCVCVCAPIRLYVNMCIYMCKCVCVCVCVCVCEYTCGYMYVCMCVTCVYISSIIIIMSRPQHGCPGPSLITRLYRPSLLVGLQGHILWRHRAVVCRFLLCLSMWSDSLEYVAYEFALTSPAVSCISGSSYFDSFRDGWSVAVQLLLCGVLPPGFVLYCSQHSCVGAVNLFLHKFS